MEKFAFVSWRSTIPRYSLIFGWQFLAAAPVTQAESQGDALPASLVTPAILQAEIAAAEVATDLSDETRNRLIELYRESLRNLETARTSSTIRTPWPLIYQSAPGRSRVRTPTSSKSA